MPLQPLSGFDADKILAPLYLRSAFVLPLCLSRVTHFGMDVSATRMSRTFFLLMSVGATMKLYTYLRCDGGKYVLGAASNSSRDPKGMYLISFPKCSLCLIEKYCLNQGLVPSGMRMR